MANYAIDPSILKPYLPKYTELDFYNGNTYVSLVGFMFNNTRMLGMKIPFHINFEEVNLRFYVRYNDGDEWKRGVVFIKEIVPRFAIAFVANNLYHEKYESMKMAHFIKQSAAELCVGYGWKYNKKWNRLEVVAGKMLNPMIAGSEEEFIAQHYWGYSKYNKQTTFAYEVKHPSWDVYQVKKFVIDCDFTLLYGSAFTLLQHTNPSSVFLAEGSEVTIFQKKNAGSISIK